MNIDRATAQDDIQQVLDSLLYVISHDFRSPLLTMTLSTELIETALDGPIAASEGAQVALASMRQGAQDMERMLQTLTLLSRARRKPVEPAQAPLRLILGGYDVTLEAGELAGRIAAVDPVQVREMLDAVAGEGELRLRLRIEGHHIDLGFDAPEVEHGPTPLHAIVASLKQYAGTPVETLAVGQVLLERRGGSVCCEAGRVVISLPLVNQAVDPG